MRMRVRTKRRLCQLASLLSGALFLLWLIVYIRQPSVHSLISGIGVDRDPLRAHIVEEHHEVVPVWLRVVRREAGLHKPVTLIHFDAHSDLGIPKFVPEFPAFRLPQSLPEVTSMMQGNDVQIFSAISSGLFSRVVWVFPYWSANKTLYHRGQVTIGETVLNKRRVFCSCIDKATRPNISRCLTAADFGSNDSPIFLPESDCPVNGSYLKEKIIDIYAQTLLQWNKSWIPAGKRHPDVWLDIDEDFFGVELVGRELLEAGLPWARVEAIDRTLKRVFCPRYVRHEVLADRWFHGLIGQLLRANCTSHTGTRDKSSSAQLCWDKQLSYEKLFRAFHTEAGNSMLCNRHIAAHVDVESRGAFLSLWANLTQTSAKQLTALGEVGLCLTTSLRTHGPPPRVGLCLGHNHPGSSSVQEHPPSPEELDQQIGRLAAIFRTLPKPALITIARSSRDGYVPRRWQSVIESRLLRLLKEVYSLSADDIVYDDMLFGGRRGWYPRHAADTDTVFDLKLSSVRSSSPRLSNGRKQ